jgi:hypothetical protein
MSVSTTKPQLNTGNEHNDINDPVVQDVLNEFREELLSSKNKENGVNSMNQQIIPPPNMIPQQLNNNQPFYNNPPGMPPNILSVPPGMPGNYQNQQPNIFYPPSASPYQNMNKNDYMMYIDIELIKKNVIIVLIVFLIYHSGVINNIYDKIPDYLQENITTFDVYIKTTLIFIILYSISYLGYV